MTRPVEVFRWRMWRRDHTLEEGLRFLAACPGTKFATSDECADWARSHVANETADLVILAIGHDHRGRVVKIRTEHTATAEAKARAA